MVLIRYRPKGHFAGKFQLEADEVPDEGDTIVPPENVMYSKKVVGNRCKITDKFYTIESDTTIYIRWKDTESATVTVEHDQYHVVVLRFAPIKERDARP